MNTTELKKLAESATPGPWIAGGASVTAKETEDCSGLDAKLKWGNWHQNARNSLYIAAANPAAILELLAINAELVEALKAAKKALAKAEGGEL